MGQCPNPWLREMEPHQKELGDIFSNLLTTMRRKAATRISLLNLMQIEQDCENKGRDRNFSRHLHQLQHPILQYSRSSESCKTPEVQISSDFQLAHRRLPTRSPLSGVNALHLKGCKIRGDIIGSFGSFPVSLGSKSLAELLE